MTPLAAAETERYIQFRVEKAGNAAKVAFEKSALKEIHKVSGGVPRIVNTVCELALLAAYSRETRVITRQLVKEAAQEVPIAR